MEEYRLEAIRARNRQCAELGMNCGEPQNGPKRKAYKYLICMEIEV
jgi:hypothetical protein